MKKITTLLELAKNKKDDFRNTIDRDVRLQDFVHKPDDELMELRSEVYGMMKDDTHLSQIELGSEDNLHRICIGDHIKEDIQQSIRSDNYLFAQKTIDLYAQMQKSLQEEGKDGIPLYSNNGDMLWPLKLPYKLIKEYLSQDTSNVE